MNTFWNTLLQQVLVVIVPPLAALAAAWVVQEIRKIGKGINSDTMTKINWAVAMAVNAAEQAGAAKLITDKKKYAIDLAQQYMAKAGVTVDLTLLDGLIEAAVKTEINKEPAVALTTNFNGDLPLPPADNQSPAA